MALIQKYNPKVGQQEVMKTRRTITFIAMVLVLATVLGMAVGAAAAKTCGITVSTVPGKPGQEVTVEVRAEKNPGFTNLAMVLDFDPAKLELVQVDLKDPEGKAYLCGDVASVNRSWKPGADDDLDAARTYPFVVCAAVEEVKADGILFTATFKVLDGTPGVLAVTPRIRYIRNNTAALPVFEDITASVTPGGVEIPAAVDKIELSAAELWLRENGTDTLTVTGVPENTPISWQSSAPQFVEVDNGTLTAKAPGTAVITASVGNAKAECRVTVVMLGDMDGDGVVKISDIMQGLDAFNMNTQLTPAQMCALDADGDGVLKDSDIMTIIERFNQQ